MKPCGTSLKLRQWSQDLRETHICVAHPGERKAIKRRTQKLLRREGQRVARHEEG